MFRTIIALILVASLPFSGHISGQSGDGQHCTSFSCHFSRLGIPQANLNLHSDYRNIEPMATESAHCVPNHTILIETAKHIVPPERYVWNWRDAIVLKAMTDIYDDCPDSRTDVLQWIVTAMNSSLSKAHGRHPNGVASGAGPAFLSRVIESYSSNCEDTPVSAYREDNGLRINNVSVETAYKNKAEQIYAQYSDIPRFQGATSHRPGRIELWDDSVYMLSMFLLEMYRSTGDEKYLNDCIREVTAHADKLRDSRTGLWWHGWASSTAINDDGCCECGWNANPQQRNGEFWGRGNGWIAMALADLLSVMPENHSQYMVILKWYRQMMDTLCKLQDKTTGHWMQLPIRIGKKDAPENYYARNKYRNVADGNNREKGANYIESSCTAMFGYALAQGLSKGLIHGKKYESAIELAHSGLWKYSLKAVSGKTAEFISMSNICTGTCIGGKDYYYSRGVTENESFAVGAVILFENRYHCLTRHGIVCQRSHEGCPIASQHTPD